MTHQHSLLARRNGPMKANALALDVGWPIDAAGFRVNRAENDFLKRGFDLAMSLILLALAVPVFLLAAIAIRLDSKGPIIYRQARVGRHGKIFDIYKLRTMFVDAESNGVPQWAAHRDPRITRVGSFLRRLRIDELPQLLNVLQGAMSLVGPRPERPFFVQTFDREIPFYAHRHRVRPGITGWAQINYPYGASLEDSKIKLAYDLHYIRHAGLVFDLVILLSTPGAVLIGRGGRLSV